MKIVLIGFMGSGKSKVGEALARKLGWDFIDTDKLVVEKGGASIPEIFRTRGEAAFRDLERQVVTEVAKKNRLVIATGGGIPLNPKNMDDLSRDGLVIWLQVSPEKVLQRAGDISTRPLIDPQDPIGSIAKRLKDRIPFYSQAPICINTDTLTVSQVADKILANVQGLKK